MGRDRWAVVFELARARAGATTVEDARTARIPMTTWYDRVQREEWFDCGAGVRLVPGAPYDDNARRHAALLALGPNALLSHDTALLLHGLSRRSAARPVHVVVPYADTTTPPHGTIRHRSRRLAPQDATMVDGYRCTTAARSLYDDAARTSQSRIEGRLLAARQRGLVTLPELREQVERRPTLPGAGRMRRALAVLDGDNVDSILEHRALALIRRHGLPEPVTQHPVRNRGHVVHADFAWPEQGVVLECDGRGFHGEEAFQRDRWRWNHITGAGLHPVWATWTDVHEGPEELVAELRSALAL